MKKPCICILLLVCLNGYLSGSVPRDAFDGYKSAILEQDGAKAVGLVTTSTIEQYQVYVDAAKYASREELEELSFLTRFQALIIRHRVPAEILKDMDGKEAFIYAVDMDWIGKTGVIPMTVDNFQVAENRALSDAYINGAKLPYQFLYRQEDGMWKFDLTQIMMNTEGAILAVAEESGLGENAFIFMVLERVSGKKPTGKLWDPAFEK